jgi:hypothetical protein
MGRYTDRRNRIDTQPFKPKGEHLIEAAIRRNGEVHGGFRSHAGVRRSLGDDDPYVSKPTDQEGFMTSGGRFVDRESALMIAIDAGQVPPSFNRQLLSSDIRW